MTPCWINFKDLSQGERSKAQAINGSSLQSEGSLCSCHHRGDSPGGRGCRPSRRRSYDFPSGSFGHSSRQGSDTPPRKRHMLSDVSFAAAGPSVSWRQPYAFAPDQPTSNSSGRSFHQGGVIPPPPPPLPSSNASATSLVSSDDEREPSAVLLLPDGGEGDMRLCRPAP